MSGFRMVRRRRFRIKKDSQLNFIKLKLIQGTRRAFPPPTADPFRR